MGIPYNQNLSEVLAVLGQVKPSSLNTTTTIGPFNTAGFYRVLFVLNIGTLGSSGTVDFSVYGEPTNGGAATQITGSAITQITTGASNIVLVEVRCETLASQGIGPWLKGTLITGTAASLVSVVVLGDYCYDPSSDHNVVAPTQVLVL